MWYMRKRTDQGQETEVLFHTTRANCLSGDFTALAIKCIIAREHIGRHIQIWLLGLWLAKLTRNPLYVYY